MLGWVNDDRIFFYIFFGELPTFLMSWHFALFSHSADQTCVCHIAFLLKKEAKTYGHDSNLLCMNLKVFPDREEVCVSSEGN